MDFEWRELRIPRYVRDFHFQDFVEFEWDSFLSNCNVDLKVFIQSPRENLFDSPRCLLVICRYRTVNPSAAALIICSNNTMRILDRAQ